MKFKNQKNERSKYRRISSNERAQIIHYLEDYKYSASHVSLIMGHNASTIKAIYQVYKREGRVNKKDKRDQILRLKRKFLVIMVDDTRDLSKMTVDSHILEDQVLKEPQLKVKVATDKAIETILEKNKFKLMSLLDQAHSLKQFLQDLKMFEEQKNPSQQFSSLKLMNSNRLKGQQIKQEGSEKFSELKKDFLESPILQNLEKVTTILNDQYCQMACLNEA